VIATDQLIPAETANQRIVAGPPVQAAVPACGRQVIGEVAASERDRLKALYQYAVSPTYLALRKAIGVTIG